MSEKKECGAQTTAGQPCRAPAMANGRCRVHGGATPAGVASPHFKHGRYSKHLPSRLLERYGEMMADPEVTSLHEAIALVDLRITEVLEGLDMGESGELWSALSAQVAALRAIERDSKQAKKDGDDAKIRDLQRSREQAIESLMFLVDAGIGERAAWSEAFDLFERRRRLAATELKRLQVAQQMVPVSEVAAMKAAVAAVIRENVHDDATLRALVAGLDRLDQRPQGGDRPGPA